MTDRRTTRRRAPFRPHQPGIVRPAPTKPYRPPAPPRDRFDLDTVLVRRNARLARLLEEVPGDR